MRRSLVEVLEVRALFAAPGLVAAYNFDEGAGVALGDLSGSGNVGALANGPAWNAAGRFGGALSFDGVNDIVNIADSNSLDLTTAVTMEAWVNPSAQAGYRTVLMKDIPGEMAYAIYGSDTGNKPSGWVRVGNTSRGGIGTAALPLNAWSHVAATYNGTHVRFYVNGVQVGARSTTGTMPTSSNPLHIGGNAVWGEYFAGLIDEVRIYNRALTPAEIQSDMATPLTPAETTPPTVSMTGPAAGAAVSGPVTLTADASDNVGVAGVQFLLDGAPVGAEDTSAPYSVTWNSDAAALGARTLTAVARDAAGNSTTAAPVSVTVVDPTAPAVSLTTPAAGATVAGSVTLTASASDNRGVAGVRFLLDGAPLGAEDTVAPFTLSWDSTTAAAGTHTLSAVARDGAGNTTTSGAVSVTVDNSADLTPPSVSLTSPAAGATVGGTATVSADASDNTGVAGVQFLLNGAPYGAEDTAAPFSVAWDTLTYANGSYALSARARDAAGNVTTSAVRNVTVYNGATVAGLVAAFSFDEAAGTTVSDASGNGHTGALSNTAWSTAGKFGGALSFNGTNSWVTVPDSSALDLTTAMTIEAWVNPASLAGLGTVVLKERPLGLSYGLYSTNSSNRPPSAYINTGGADQRSMGPTVLPLNTWSHLAATYNGSNLVLFVNGVQAFSRAVSGGIVVSAGALRIGGNSVWTEWFNGLIDDVRVYSRTLTAAEISADMATPVAPPAPDTTAPSVSVSSPVAGSTVGGIVTVTASASDNVGVAGVQFKLDGVDLGAEDTTAPYTYYWDATTAASGAHVLTAVARDRAGNIKASDPVGVTVHNDTTAPTVAITGPADGSTVSGTVPVTADASDDTAVVGVQFRLDGVNLGAEDTTAPYSVSWDTTASASGNRQLTAVARDAAGNVRTSTVITVNNPDVVAPTVALSTPASAANVTGDVTVTATASDNVGVVGVRFLLNGAPLGEEDTTSPYSVLWDSRAVANGSHTLSAVARDLAGNTTTSAVRPVTVNNVSTDVSVVGQWSSVVNFPLVAVTSVLLKDGRILMWDGGAGCIGSTSARVWDPATGVFTAVPLPYYVNVDDDIWCSGQALLSDGRVLVVGGHDCDGPDLGIKMVNIFDPATMTWTRGPDMTYKRWYPTATTLADGRVLVTAGSVKNTLDYVAVPEIYDPVTNSWSTLPGAAGTTIPNYAFVFQNPDGRVIAAGSDEAKMATYALNLATQTWDVVDPTVLDAGSGVMYLPGKVMKAGSSYLSAPANNGGDVPSAATTYVLDTTSPGPNSWTQTTSMANPRTHLNLTVLPDGTVLGTGGSTNIGGLTASRGVLPAELWSPATKSWTTMSSMATARMYHSTALLMPDGRVLVAGGGRLNVAPDYLNAEIFSPGYLFKGARPAVTSAPNAATYGSSFFVGTAQADTIASVALVRNGSVTHSFNMDQRFVPVSFTRTAGGLTVQAPADANAAPPGHYMLFIVNDQGVPSIAPIVHLGPVTDTLAPTAPANLVAVGSVASASLSWGAATDDVGVKHYNIYRSLTDGFTPSATNRIAQVASLSYVDRGLAAGTYYYLVAAEDAVGRVGPASNQSVAVTTADVTSPSVAVTNPAGGSTVSGAIFLTAAASDDVAVAGVQFLLDGVAVGAEDTSAPYSVPWNSSSVINGAHTIAARARDAAGNTTTSAVANVTVSNTVTSPNLVALYAFDEGSGAAVTDGSGRANNGTISGGATWTAAGRYGSGMVFNGIDGMVTIPDSSSLDLTTGMTMEAWVKPTAAANYPTILMKERPGGLAYTLYGAVGAGKSAGAYVRTTADLAASGGGALPLNTWSHLAGTHDGSTIRLYLNGVLVASRAAGGTITNSNSPLRIGGNSIWNNEWFNGVIDEVRVYNTALSAEQIQADMNQAPPAVTYDVSGAISPTGDGAGASLTITGTKTAQTITANASGQYIFTGIADGTYTIRPSKTGFAFTPSSQVVTVAGGSLTDVNFTAAVAPTPTIQLVQSAAHGLEAGRASLSLTVPNIRAGSFLVITGTAARLANALTLTDTAGNSFLLAAGPFVDPVQELQVYVWYVPVAVGGTSTFTITPTRTSALEIHVSEWIGFAPTASVDQVSFAAGNGSVISSGAKTTTVDGELIFGYAWVYNTATPGPGFTSLSLVNGDLDTYQIQAAAGITEATFGHSAPGDWFALMVTFKPA
jgi:hypothetical protein